MVRAVAAASLLAASCTIITDQSMYETNGGDTAFAITASLPRDGDTGVLLDSTITLSFSDFPNPGAATYPTITLRSLGSFDFSTTVDLAGSTVRIKPRAAL